MRLKRETRLLHQKALSSLRRAAKAFNDFDDDGRVCTVLLHLQHSFEMLLKAGLVQRNATVFDRRSGRAIGFEKCLNKGRTALALTDDEVGTLRAIDALRDDQQHWLTEMSEGLLYLHCRAGFTLFDDLLQRMFGESLADHLPHRVLPISSEPPRDVQILLDEEYEYVQALLAPGKRRRPEARARIRSLLAMEAHLKDDAEVSKADVDRVERAVKSGENRQAVFPVLNELGSDLAGEGVLVEVRFSKRDGVPVRLVGADDADGAGAIRQVDLQRKFYMSAYEMADRLGLTRARERALRRSLNLNSDPNCAHTFEFGSQRHPRFSDNALRAMQQALADGVDMDDVWARFGDGRRGRVA